MALKPQRIDGHAPGQQSVQQVQRGGAETVVGAAALLAAEIVIDQLGGGRAGARGMKGDVDIGGPECFQPWRGAPAALPVAGGRQRLVHHIDAG